MSISVDQLLKKIESELHKAKQAEGPARVRENIHSIKILCELILEEKEVGTLQPSVPQVQSIPTLTSKKLEEAEANGDSLFDF